MKRIPLPHVRPVFAVLLLATALCLAGVAYASWNQILSVQGRVGTGNFDTRFDFGRAFEVQIVGVEGTSSSSAAGTEGVTCLAGGDGKHALLSLMHDVLLNELIDGNLLKLQFPIETSGTVTSIKPISADFSAQPDEILETAPSGIYLEINGIQYAPDGIEGLMPTLSWEVYRQIETDGGQVSCVIFLRLSPESANALRTSAAVSINAADLPEELLSAVVAQGDGQSGTLSAEVTASYTLSVPLYIEQGN